MTAHEAAISVAPGDGVATRQRHPEKGTLRSSARRSAWALPKFVTFDNPVQRSIVRKLHRVEGASFDQIWRSKTCSPSKEPC